jgi:hypothetical protein
MTNSLEELEQGPWPKAVREWKEINKTALQEAYAEGAKTERERIINKLVDDGSCVGEMECSNNCAKCWGLYLNDTQGEG